MPDFSTTPINSDVEVDKWLKFYEMSAPLIAVGTLISGDYVFIIMKKKIYILTIYLLIWNKISGFRFEGSTFS